MKVKIIKHPFPVILYGSIVICMVWTFYGKVTPIISETLQIYLDQTKTFTVVLVFMMIAGSFLNLSVPRNRLTYAQVFLNLIICFLCQGIVRLIDTNILIVLCFMAFILLMSIFICVTRKKAGCKKIRLIYYLRNVILIGIIIFILPGQLYVKFNGGPVFYEHIVAQNNLPTEKSLDENRIREMLRATDEKWKDLSLSEKAECLKDVAEYEAGVLGIEPANVYVRDFENTFTLGYYEENNIHLNAYFLGTTDTLGDSLSTIMHELYHKYQKVLIEGFKDGSNPLLKLAYFDKINEWIDADEKYFEDKKNFDTYYENPLEESARNYANSIVEKYELVGIK